MSVFLAQSVDGRLSLGSEYNASRFRDDLKKNSGARYRIERLTPESREMRGFFEGAVVPLCCYYQEGMDHRNNEDIKTMRSILKLEFCGKDVLFDGKIHRVEDTSKGAKKLKKLIEDTIDWLNDQGGQVEVLNPNEYKKWRDTIFPFASEQEPDNYIDFLVTQKILKPVL